MTSIGFMLRREKTRGDKKLSIILTGYFEKPPVWLLLVVVRPDAAMLLGPREPRDFEFIEMPYGFLFF